MNVGGTYRVPLEAVNAAGELFNPRVPPVLYLQSEDGFYQLRFDDPVHDGLGLYHRDVLFPDSPHAAGIWSYYWDVDGSAAGRYQFPGQLGPLAALQPTRPTTGV